MTNKEVLASQMSKVTRPWRVLTLSARTKTALDAATINLVNYFKQHPHTSLADVAYTLHLDQKACSYRRAVVCQDIDDAITALEATNCRRVFNSERGLEEKSVVFMLSGQGTQYVNMGRELYQNEPLFRDQVNSCSEQLKLHLGLDLRTILYPNEAQTEMAMEQIHQALIAQPAIFVIEYALAQLLMSWGTKPQAMIGHSIGEYVAACLAGVFSLEDALRLVAVRSRFIQQQPAGMMLAVPLSEQEIQSLLNEDISLAAVNSPTQCVVAGSISAIASLEKCLNEKGLETRKLHTSHAFHSLMMLPVASPFVEQMKQTRLYPPHTPFISNVTGTWISAEEAVNPDHWGKELLQTVRFADGLQALLQKPNMLLLEIGAGRTLSILSRQQISIQNNHVVYTSLRHPNDPSSDAAFLLNTLAQLWVIGVNVNWSAFYAHEQRQRIVLSIYSVDQQRSETESHWFMHSDQRKLVAKRNVLSVGNELEQCIASAWQELLGIDCIGLDENFFKLGGDSLLSSQLIARLRQTFHVELPLTAIFENPTIAGLAEIVVHSEASTKNEQIKMFAHKAHHYEEQLLAKADQLTDEEVKVLNTNKIFPLSSAQQRLWFLDQLQHGSPVYHIAVAYRFKGELDDGVLERSLNEIIRRHETLRTTFSVIRGQPMQIIAPSLTIKLERENLEKFPVEQQETEVLKRATKEAQRRFDLAEGPLLRVRLLRLNRYEFVLVLIIHHIISDGWSMGILYQELTTLYEAYVQDKPSPLPELPIQYADYTVWEYEWLQDNRVLKRELAYWKQQLADAPAVLELPINYPRPPAETFRGAYETFMLPFSLVEEIKELSQREGVTLFMTLLAAFQVLIACYSRQDDIVVGTDVANRNHVEIENLIGFFVNQLVLRTDISGNPSFSKLLQRVRRIVLDAYRHQNVPFDQLVRTLNPTRFPNRAPLFQTKLVLQNLPVLSKSSTFTIAPLLIDTGAAQLDLLLALTETASGLQGVWQYSTDLFTVNTIKQMGHHFSEVLKAFVASPSHTLSVFDTTLNEEKAQQRCSQQNQLAQFRHQRFKMVRSKPVSTFRKGE